MEIVVTLALFGIFLFILVQLTAEMRSNEKRAPVNFLAHPQVGAIMARLRRDILDTKYYPKELAGYQQTDKTLILSTITPSGTTESVVYDFRTAGEVHRKTFIGTTQQTDWVARGVPQFQYEAYGDDDSDRMGVEVKAYDGSDLAIDQIFLPRSQPLSSDPTPTSTDTSGTTGTNGTSDTTGTTGTSGTDTSGTDTSGTTGVTLT
jgi:hypothetical protein